LELAEGKGVSTVLEAKSYLGRYENLYNGCVLGSYGCVWGHWSATWYLKSRKIVRKKALD
jgi:hypothetical protein